MPQLGPGRPGRTAGIESLKYPVPSFFCIELLGELALAIQNNGSVPPFGDLLQHCADGRGLAAAAITGDQKMFALVTARDDDFAQPQTRWVAVYQALDHPAVEAAVELLGCQQTQAAQVVAACWILAQAPCDQPDHQRKWEQIYGQPPAVSRRMIEGLIEGVPVQSRTGQPGTGGIEPQLHTIEADANPPGEAVQKGRLAQHRAQHPTSEINVLQLRQIDADLVPDQAGYQRGPEHHGGESRLKKKLDGEHGTSLGGLELCGWRG